MLASRLQALIAEAEMKGPPPPLAENSPPRERRRSLPKQSQPPKDSAVNIEVGSTRPVPFNTTLLNPKTHKTAYGQITVLQSRSLLVDFRECQRRAGRKGNTVFVVNPTGIEARLHYNDLRRCTS